MATEEDAKALRERVYNCAYYGKLGELTEVLEEHPEVDVDGHKSQYGWTALYWACYSRHTECAQLLIDHKADVNNQSIHAGSILHSAAKNGYLVGVELLVENGADVNCQLDSGWTPVMSSSLMGRLNITHFLVEHKADVHHRVLEEEDSTNKDALYCAMGEYVSDRTPGFTFAMLLCNTDAKNVNIDDYVTAAMRDAHIEHYQHVQAFIDEYHRILNLVLSDHVPVDPRFGLGQMGIYQEPLERTLEYLGLSMSKDQVVNTSIDGEEGVKRALIPGHLLNANHWFHKYAESR
jgi:hypothetical protein